MIRSHDSASSLELASRCLMAYVLRYAYGISEPDVPWSVLSRDPDRYSSRQRSTALGKGAHARCQSYVAGGAVEWLDLPGQVAGAWVPWLPALGTHAEIEVPIGIGWGGVEVEVTHDGRAARTPAISVDGQPVIGYRDLGYGFGGTPITAAQIPGWALGEPPGGALTVDLKTSRDTSQWAKTPDDLPEDLQCCLYALDGCTRTGADANAVRWLYSETGSTRRAVAVDAIIPRATALATVERYARILPEIRAIDPAGKVPANFAACDSYGGCPHCLEYSEHGACPVRRTIGMRAAIVSLAAGDRRVVHMAIDQALADRVAAAKARAAGGVVAAPAAAPRPVAAPRPRKTPTPRASEAAPEAETTPPEIEPEVSASDDPVAVAYAAYADARGQLLAAQAAVDQTLVALRDVCGAE